MTLQAFNKLRAYSRVYSLLFTLLLVIAVILLIIQQFYSGFFVLSLSVIGFSLFFRVENKINNFKCPACGKNPLVWTSSDPTEDAVYHDYDARHCLNCKASIGEAERFK